MTAPQDAAQVASAEFAPSTGQVRNRYAAGRRALDARDARLSPADLEAEFDAWLAEHDAQVAARALREFATRCDGQAADAGGGGVEFRMYAEAWEHAADGAREWADRIERQRAREARA